MVKHNHNENNIVAVCSGSKGVGKTWFTAALCQSLSLKKQKVLFFDADGGIENIAWQLGLKQSDLYVKMLKNEITLNNAVTTYSKGKFDVIYADPKKNFLSAYPVGRSQILAMDLKNFSFLYDQVLVDCSETNVQLKNIFLHLADKIILMMESNSTGLTSAYKELEHIKLIYPLAEVFVVVNHVFSKSEGEQTFQTLLEADKQFIGLKPKLLGVINQDGRIRDCVLNKTTLFERYPICQSLTEIGNISKLLIHGDI